MFVSALNCVELGKPAHLIVIYMRRISDDLFLRDALPETSRDRYWTTIKKEWASENQQDAYILQKHHQEKPVSYDVLYIEIKTWQGWTEPYPLQWPSSSGQVDSMATLYNVEEEIAALRFYTGFGQFEDFVVLFERRASLGGGLSANIFMLHRSKQLVDTVLKFAKKEQLTVITVE